MKDKAVVLLSAGLDSTYNLCRAQQELDVVLTLTFDYGQRAAQREVAQARAISDHFGLQHQVVEFPWFSLFTKTSLVNSSQQLPVGDKVQIDDFEASTQTAKAVWVPNRNGIFLNVAAAFAESLEAQWVIPGFNAEEATTFPDNTPEFLETLDRSFRYSTSTGVRTRCYSAGLTKSEIVKAGRTINLPFDLVWPCYQGGDTLCGECESCLRYQRAMQVNS